MPPSITSRSPGSNNFRRVRSAFLILFISLAVFTCCVIYGRQNFYRDPGSIFYDKSRAFVRWYSAYRQEQAESFIERFAALTAEKQVDVAPKSDANARVCASFLTVQRPGQDLQYLDISLGSALDRLEPRERKDLNLKVFFADTDQAKHPSWHEPWLRSLVDEVYSYADFSADVLKKGQELDLAHEPFKKSPFDYSLALQRCFNSTSAPYIAVFEDDVIIAEGWLARALSGLQEVEIKMAKQGRAGQWLYVRLFNQERSTGWGSKKISGNLEIPISAIVGLVMWAIFTFVRRRSRTLQLYTNGWTIAIICCITVPAFVVLFYQCGKASLLPPSPGIKEQSFGCCAQGIIFNREHIPGLVEYMRDVENEGQDMVTRDYAWQEALARWSIYPVSVQHIGVHSSIQTDKLESQSVWSMAFETLDPERLDREHEEMVNRIYGSAE